ncbi:hypothetical protein [Paracoccus sp. (in: a-proteobacteria)]|jgi:hypothetical protein|uniref:hypothetical protein n=1 Tax=Paracoccus sp. TaxID=267 RepID=UPI0035B39600
MCSLLLCLLAFGAMMQHGQSASAADMPGHYITAAMSDAAHSVAQPDGPKHHALTGGISDACAIMCLGTPSPWGASAQFAPFDTSTSLKRQFKAAKQQGRCVGPGYRPPRSI